MEVDTTSLDIGSKAILAFLSAAGGIFCTWWKMRKPQQREVGPQPFEVKATPEYVTRGEFDRHCKDNESEHKNLFERMASTERETSKIAGLLEAIHADLQLIKGKLFGGKKQ